MDLLVAQYSRPAFQDEGYSTQEQQELSETVPPLSLRFAMPPIAKVNIVGCYEHMICVGGRMVNIPFLALSFSTSCNG